MPAAVEITNEDRKRADEQISSARATVPPYDGRGRRTTGDGDGDGDEDKDEEDDDGGSVARARCHGYRERALVQMGPHRHRAGRAGQAGQARQHGSRAGPGKLPTSGSAHTLCLPAAAAESKAHGGSGVDRTTCDGRPARGTADQWSVLDVQYVQYGPLTAPQRLLGASSYCTPFLQRQPSSSAGRTGSHCTTAHVDHPRLCPALLLLGRSGPSHIHSTIIRPAAEHRQWGAPGDLESLTQADPVQYTVAAVHASCLMPHAPRPAHASAPATHWPPAPASLSADVGDGDDPISMVSTSYCIQYCTFKQAPAAAALACMSRRARRRPTALHRRYLTGSIQSGVNDLSLRQVPQVSAIQCHHSPRCQLFQSSPLARRAAARHKALPCWQLTGGARCRCDEALAAWLPTVPVLAPAQVRSVLTPLPWDRRAAAAAAAAWRHLSIILASPMLLLQSPASFPHRQSRRYGTRSSAGSAVAGDQVSEHSHPGKPSLRTTGVVQRRARASSTFARFRHARASPEDEDLGAHQRPLSHADRRIRGGSHRILDPRRLRATGLSPFHPHRPIPGKRWRAKDACRAS
nr:hypothetical protein CFP56_52376 [Quercus suber]